MNVYMCVIVLHLGHCLSDNNISHLLHSDIYTIVLEISLGNQQTHHFAEQNIPI